jgi:AraC-like DNA-binding protein
MYSERGSAVVPGAVLWRQDHPEAGQVLPDGCMDLIWWGGEVVIAGPDTHAFPVGSDRTSCVGIRFSPGTLPGLLGVPAAELRDRRIPLADVLPRDEPRLADALAGCSGSVGEAAVLERYSAALSTRSGAGLDPRVTTVLSMIGSGGSVGGIADQLGCSERQLHRLSLQRFGYGPKTLDRILRLQRALRLAGTGVPAAEVAVLAGYADQAHLVRDARRLTGLPFGALAGGAEGQSAA